MPVRQVTAVIIMSLKKSTKFGGIGAHNDVPGQSSCHEASAPAAAAES